MVRLLIWFQPCTVPRSLPGDDLPHQGHPGRAASARWRRRTPRRSRAGSGAPWIPEAQPAAPSTSTSGLADLAGDEQPSRVVAVGEHAAEQHQQRLGQHLGAQHDAGHARARGCARRSRRGPRSRRSRRTTTHPPPPARPAPSGRGGPAGEAAPISSGSVVRRRSRADRLAGEDARDRPHGRRSASGFPAASAVHSADQSLTSSASRSAKSRTCSSVAET